MVVKIFELRVHRSDITVESFIAPSFIFVIWQNYLFEFLIIVHYLNCDFYIDLFLSFISELLVVVFIFYRVFDKVIKPMVSILS